MSAVLLAQSITEDISSPSILPSPVKFLLDGVFYAHRVWRWIRLGKIYTNPHNFLHLAAGHGLNALAGDYMFVRVSAIAVLIATRILDAAEAFDDLQTAWKKLTLAWKNEYPSPIHVSWKSDSDILSLSSLVWLRTTYQELLVRIKRIALAILRVVKEALILSMRLMDAAECFYMSPDLKQESINLLFVNASRCLDKLVQERSYLIQGLRNNKTVIQKVLDGIGSILTAEQLIAEVDNGLGHVETFHQSTKSANNEFVEFLEACGKKWTFQILYEFGLHRLLPPSMMPPATVPWKQPHRIAYQNRYPPDESVAKETTEREYHLLKA